MVVEHIEFMCLSLGNIILDMYVLSNVISGYNIHQQGHLICASYQRFPTIQECLNVPLSFLCPSYVCSSI